MNNTVTRRTLAALASFSIALAAHAQSSPPPPMNYFPAGTFALVRGHADLRNTWYARHLSAMGEQPLATSTPAGGESYRFLHLPTWGRPFAVRVERRNGVVTLTTVRLSGNGGYEPGHVEATASHTIPEATWLELRRRVDALSFFTLPTSGPMGMDGEQWIVEGVRDGHYHLVDRWAPNDDVRFRGYFELCEWLGALASPVWTRAPSRAP